MIAENALDVGVLSDVIGGLGIGGSVGAGLPLRNRKSLSSEEPFLARIRAYFIVLCIIIRFDSPPKELAAQLDGSGTSLLGVGLLV